MGNVIYLSDRQTGLHCFTPEMCERKPDVKLEAHIGHYGGYFIDTPLELKGRGIKKLDDPVWINGCKKQVEHWKSYKVTDLAFEKLKSMYPIGMECVLD